MSQPESNQGQPGTGPPTNSVDVRSIIIGGGVMGGVVALFTLCTVWRIRMVRRRRIALGLPPVEARWRRRDSEDEDDEDLKPVLYDAWVELGVETD
ncbi:hypothetical protein FRC00_008423, partial [Tulasnella sp. 408]